MFFALALLSMVGYAFQGTFLVRYARQMDEFTLAMYRNLSLGITMLPVFLLTDPRALFTIPEVTWWVLCGACVSGVLGFSLSTAAQRSLPVGIVSSFSGPRLMLTLLWGYLFFRELITLPQLFAISLIMIGVIFLSWRKSHMPHLDGKVLRGFLSAATGTFFGSWAFFLVSLASRQIPPLLAGYLWEFGIGFCALCLVFVRHRSGIKKFTPVAGHAALRIALISSWTLFGTGAFSLAVNLGPIGIVNAVGSAGIVVSSLLSHFLYREKLHPWQWTAIWLVVIGIAGLRLFGA